MLSGGKKANKSKLRSRIFGPVECARAERLSTKLYEIVSQPKPEHERKGANTTEYGAKGVRWREHLNDNRLAG